MDYRYWITLAPFIVFITCTQTHGWTSQAIREVKWFTNKYCRDAKGDNGTCVSLQHCFIGQSLPDFSGWADFIAGDYTSCAYITDKGVPFVGACCTADKISPATEVTTIPTTTSSTSQPFRPGVPIGDPIFIPLPFPSNPAIPPNWPPTLPPPITHPPGHFPPWVPRPTPVTTKRPKTRRPTTPHPTWWPQQTKPTTTTEIPIIITAPPDTQNEIKCGNLKDAFRVVPGEKTVYWPWMVGLVGKRGLFCGGSLISNYHVLTAAHCVYGLSPNAFEVRLGDYNLASTTDYNHMTLKVSNIMVNPSYSTRTNHHDLAILRLASRVAFNDNILPVCLPTIGTSRSYAGKEAVVIGWGANRFRGPTSKVLMQGIMPVLTVNECQNTFRRHYPNQIVSTNICAGGKGKDSCSGDSGGPLMYYENDQYTQIGIVSWGIGCGSGNYPGVYTRVSSYIDWIQSNLN